MQKPLTKILLPLLGVLALTTSNFAQAQACSPIASPAELNREVALYALRTVVPLDTVAKLEKVPAHTKATHGDGWLALTKSDGSYVVGYHSKNKYTRQVCADVNKKYTGSSNIPEVSIRNSACETHGLMSLITDANQLTTIAPWKSTPFICVKGSEGYFLLAVSPE